MRKAGWVWQCSQVVAVLLAVLILVVTTAHGLAVQKAESQVPLNVHDTKMAPFRAMAQLTFEAFKKKDYRAAATLAKLLEVFWDATKGDASEQKSGRMSDELFSKIDGAMDAFVNPIAGYGRGLTHNQPVAVPDAVNVETAYKEYLSTLKLGD
jgi:hypothetical protein